MNPALKLYLDKLHAETKAQYAEIHKQLQLQETLFSKFDTGASTPQSAGSAVVTSDGGLTVDATAVAAVPDVSSSTTKALEVLPDASLDSIDPMPVTCSTDCSNQVVATAVCSEPAVDLNDNEVEQLAPARATPSIGTGISSITEEVTPSVAATTDVNPKAGVQELDALPLFSINTSTAVTSEAYHIVDPSDLAASTLAMCSTRPMPWPSLVCSHELHVKHARLLSQVTYEVNWSAAEWWSLISYVQSSYEVHAQENVQLKLPWPYHDVVVDPIDIAAPTPIICSTVGPDHLCDKRLHPSYSEQQPWPTPVQVKIRHMGHLFRPRPWPSFKSHSDASYPEEPDSGMHSQPQEGSQMEFMLGHAALCSTPSIDNLQKTVQTLNMSVWCAFWSQEGFKEYLGFALDKAAVASLHIICRGVPLPSMCTHFQAEKIQNWMLSLVQLQHCPFREASYLVPVVVTTMPDNCHDIVKLQRVIGEGALVLRGNCSKAKPRPPPWPSFPCICQTVQVWSELPKVAELALCTLHQRMLQAMEKFRDIIPTVTTKNSGSNTSILSVIIPLVLGSKTSSLGNILVLTWRSQGLPVEQLQAATPSCAILVLNCLGSSTSYKSGACSPDKYVVVVQLTHYILDFMGSVYKRGVQPNPVVNKKFESNSCRCFGIHLVGSLLILIELEQCTDKSSYGIEPVLHPLCMCTSRALMTSLFECPLSPCTEFLVGNIAAYLNSCAVSASGNCSDLYSFVQFEKLWAPGTKTEVCGHMWSEPLSSAFRRHWDPGDEQWHSEESSEQYSDLLVLLACLTVQYIRSLQFWGSAKLLPPTAPILIEPQVLLLGYTSPVTSDFIQRVSYCSRFSLAAGALYVSDLFQVIFSTSAGTLISQLAPQLHNIIGIESVFGLYVQILKQACCSTFNHFYHKLDNPVPRLIEQQLSFPEPDTDACKHDHKQAAIDGNQGWYSLCHACLCDLANLLVVVWVGYPISEVHKSWDPWTIHMPTSHLQPSKIIMAMVISKGARAIGGMTSFTCYNQEHFQGGRGVITVATIFTQGYVDHEYYLCFDQDCTANDYILGAFFDWVSLGNGYYFSLGHDHEYYLGPDFGYHRDSDQVKGHRVQGDPSSSRRRRLGVKPNFKEGGMLGTPPNLYTYMGLPLSTNTWAWPGCDPPSAAGY